MKLYIKESDEDFEVIKRFQVSYIEGDNPYDDSAQVYDNGSGFEIVKDPETGLYGWQSDAMDESSDVEFNSFDDAYNDAVEAHNSDNGILMIDGEVVGDFDEVDDSDDSDDFNYSVTVAKEKEAEYQPEDVSPEGVFLYDGKKKRTNRIKYDIIKLIIKPGIEEIDEGPFNNLHRLKSVKIPKTVKRIRSYSFFDCPNLKSIIIPDSVNRIDSHVFVRCPNLKKVVIPNSVTHLGSGIFFGNEQDITIYTDSKYVKDYCLEQEENITVKPLHQFNMNDIDESLVTKNELYYTDTLDAIKDTLKGQFPELIVSIVNRPKRAVRVEAEKVLEDNDTLFNETFYIIEGSDGRIKALREYDKPVVFMDLDGVVNFFDEYLNS